MRFVPRSNAREHSVSTERLQIARSVKQRFRPMSGKTPLALALQMCGVVASKPGRRASPLILAAALIIIIIIMIIVKPERSTMVLINEGF